MKKLVLSAALAASLAVPAVADEADTATDPFLATQGLETGLGIVAATTVIILIAAADSASGTD